jgi:hypothetical protein
MDEIQKEPSNVTTPEQDVPSANTPVKAKDARAKLVAELAARRSKAAAADASDDEADEAPKATKAKVEPKVEAKAETAIEKKIEAKEEKLERAGVDVPDQRKSESDADYDLRLAKLLREKNEAIQTADKATKETAKLVKLIEAGKANPLTILEHLGVSFEDLVKGINAKKYAPPGAKPSVPQEILDQIAELKKDKSDREAAEQAKSLKAESEARMAADTKKVSAFLDANSDDFPFLASVPWATQEILTQANEKGVTDVMPIMQRLEENLANNAEKLITSDKAMRAAIKKNPALKDVFKKMFEEDAPKAKKSKGDDEEVEIRGLDDLTRDPPARTTKKTREDVKAELAAEMKARRRKAADSDDD